MQEFSSEDVTTPGSPDDLFLKDLNPCLTPFSVKKKTAKVIKRAILLCYFFIIYQWEWEIEMESAYYFLRAYLFPRITIISYEWMVSCACRNSRHRAMILLNLMMKAFAWTAWKWAVSLDSVLILIAENFTKVLIVTRTPTQAAELPDQFGSQMKVNAHMGSKCCIKSFNWSVSRLDS